MLPDDFVRQIALDPLAANIPARHDAVGVQHVQRVVCDTFDQEAEVAFGLVQIPLLLFVFSKHSTACLTGVKAPVSNRFP